MIEPIFEVNLTKDKHEVIAINEEAKDLEKTWYAEFPNTTILILILNSPNTLEELTSSTLTYAIAPDYKEEVLNELRKVIK